MSLSVQSEPPLEQIVSTFDMPLPRQGRRASRLSTSKKGNKTKQRRDILTAKETPADAASLPVRCFLGPNCNSLGCRRSCCCCCSGISGPLAAVEKLLCRQRLHVTAAGRSSYWRSRLLCLATRRFTKKVIVAATHCSTRDRLRQGLPTHGRRLLCPRAPQHTDPQSGGDDTRGSLRVAWGSGDPNPKSQTLKPQSLNPKL